MASGSANPAGQEPPRPAADTPSTETSAPSGGPPPPGNERYGPLSVLRMRKDDGRELTLYGVADDDGEPAAG